MNSAAFMPLVLIMLTLAIAVLFAAGIAALVACLAKRDGASISLALLRGGAAFGGSLALFVGILTLIISVAAHH